MKLKENNIALSEDFLKKNAAIVPSIVGKNLLSEPFEIKNMDKSYRKGASIKDGWCIKVTNEVFTISIDEELAAALEASNGLNLNGQNIIIKSVKVVEW